MSKLELSVLLFIADCLLLFVIVIFSVQAQEPPVKDWCRHESGLDMPMWYCDD